MRPQEGQDANNRNSSASQTSVEAVEADPEWAPHVDLGRQLATLHVLLVDSLPKLPGGRTQVRDSNGQ
jgi:hypothetical protein